MVYLTSAGKLVLFGTGPVRLVLPSETTARPAGARAPKKRAAAAAASLTPEAQALFERLRAKRLELARADGVPPYVVASDRTLHELAELRPATLAALEGIYGIGPAKVARYGEAWLAVLRRE